METMLTAKNPEEYKRLYDFYQNLPVSLQTVIGSGKISFFTSLRIDFEIIPFGNNDIKVLYLPNDHIIKAIAITDECTSVWCRADGVEIIYTIPDSVKNLEVLMES